MLYETEKKLKFHNAVCSLFGSECYKFSFNWWAFCFSLLFAKTWI